jgi:hypothetical protein
MHHSFVAENFKKGREKVLKMEYVITYVVMTINICRSIPKAVKYLTRY